jgi:hypothetical protein
VWGKSKGAKKLGKKQKRILNKHTYLLQQMPQYWLPFVKIYQGDNWILGLKRTGLGEQYGEEKKEKKKRLKNLNLIICLFFCNDDSVVATLIRVYRVEVRVCACCKVYR